MAQKSAQLCYFATQRSGKIKMDNKTRLIPHILSFLMLNIVLYLLFLVLYSFLSSFLQTFISYNLLTLSLALYLAFTFRGRMERVICFERFSIFDAL